MDKIIKKNIFTFLASVLVIITLILTNYQEISSNLILGLDLQGGFEVLYEVTPLDENSELPAMSDVANSISKRVDVLGVSEPQIIIEGENRVRIQLAGVSDQDTARELLSSTANLTFRDVNDNLLADASIIAEGGASLAYDGGRAVVSLDIADEDAFADLTAKVASKQNGENLIVTWLDFEEGDSYRAELIKENNGEEPKYISVAGVSQAIRGDAVISGNFDEDEARNLASLISSGSLPVKMNEISSNVVSAEFGVLAFEETLFAGAIGVLIVILFMIYKYRIMGIIASIMLAFYIFAIFYIYSGIQAVFTLTGIAALVLGVGMTLDANIITFERIKDEIINGSDIKTACKKGQSFSISTILDAQLTTLLAAIIMYVFGNGAVKGFATMLMITVVCTLLINVLLSRFLLNQLVNTNLLNDKASWFNAKKNNSKFINQDYIKNSKIQIMISTVIISLGIIMMLFNFFNGNAIFNFGIDFSSGTKISVNSSEVIEIEEVEAQMLALGYSNAEYQKSGDNTVNITLKEALETDELELIKDTYYDLYNIEPNDTVITPIVGQDLVKNAFLLSILAWVGMLIYVTIRFKWDYALSCIIALLHDVFIVLAIFAIFRIEVNIELVSVILAIIGYSINNSIVVFDRVREKMKDIDTVIMDTNVYKELVNEALSNTMVRSIYSSLTTIIPVVALLLIGSNSIYIFNIAMFIGLIAGTLSSIYVSPYIWYQLRIKNHNKPVKVKNKKSSEPDEMMIAGVNDYQE